MGAEVIDKVDSLYLADVIGSVSSVIVISPLSFSPVGQPILAFLKGRNKLLSILPSAPT